MNDDQLIGQLRDPRSSPRDVLDTMGWQHQFLPAGSRRSEIDAHRRPGHAELDADVVNDGVRSAGPLSGKPCGLMLEELDDLRPGKRACR